VLLLSKHFFPFDNQSWQKRGRHFLFGSKPLDWILAVQLECKPGEFTRYGTGSMIQSSFILFLFSRSSMRVFGDNISTTNPVDLPHPRL
jgi:hypothetical protein